MMTDSSTYVSADERGSGRLQGRALRLVSTGDETGSNQRGAVIPRVRTITERNRVNAQRSTGPRTPGGKRRSRCNSLKHGLAANPAAGVVESPEQFRRLHVALVERLQPRDVVEAGLVHRIGTCLWRLQRAALADRAMTEHAVRSVTPHREHIQDWIHEIQDAWRTEIVPGGRPSMCRQEREVGIAGGDQSCDRLIRTRLHALDRLRNEEMMRSGAALSAMRIMLNDLRNRLTTHPRSFSIVECEQLAWLLGENALRLPLDQDEIDFPDVMPGARPVDLMIGEARRRPSNTPLPTALSALIDGQRAKLRQQSAVVERERGLMSETLQRQAALLPDAGTLDRLIRYERHAERGLYGALQALAHHRGEAIDSVMTAIHARAADGSEVHVQQMLPWSAPNDEF